MKPKSLILLFVAGGCGLVAALAIMQHLSATSVLPSGPPAEARKPVIVAADDYEAGTLLKPDMLKKVEMPEQGLPEDTYSDPAQVTGQTLRMQVFKGELVLMGKLGGDRGLDWLSHNLPPGMTLATIHLKVEEAQLIGLVNPGDHLDVMWLPGRPDLRFSVTTLLQNVKVGAVGQKTEASRGELSGAKDSRSQDTSYTLLVTHDQHMRLIAAGKNGSFRLALRGKGDKSVEQLDEETLDIILGLKAPRIEKPQAAPDTISEPEPTVYKVEYVREGHVDVEALNVPDPAPGTDKKRSFSKK